MVKDCPFMAVGESRLQWRASQDQQPRGSRRYPVDFANGSSLAGLAQEIPQSVGTQKGKNHRLKSRSDINIGGKSNGLSPSWQISAG